MPRSSATVRRTQKLTDFGNSLALGLQRGVYSISLHCIPWPVACSEWGACFTEFWFQILGTKTLNWKFLKLSSRIHRRDTELRIAAKFGENWPLRSCRKIVLITTQKKLVPAPILPKMGRSRPKFSERCHPLTCPHKTRIPNLVRIDYVLPDLLRKDWFFGLKSQYSIGFQPIITRSSAIAERPRVVKYFG